MSGITANLIGNDLFQRFTADGTWKKPVGIKMVAIECVGAGGSGAGDSNGGSTRGGGGGGGACAYGVFDAAALSNHNSCEASKTILSVCSKVERYGML